MLLYVRVDNRLLRSERIERYIPAEVEKEERRPASFAYFLAALATILILLTVCKPSRKGTER